MQRSCERPRIFQCRQHPWHRAKFPERHRCRSRAPRRSACCYSFDTSRSEAAKPNLLDLDRFAMSLRWSPPVAWIGGLADSDSKESNLPQDTLSAVATTAWKVMLPAAVLAALVQRFCAKGLEAGGRLTPWVVQPPMCSFAPPPKRPWHSLVPAGAVRAAGVVRPLPLVAAIFHVACHAIVTALTFMVIGSALVLVALLAFLGAKVSHSLIDIVT